MIAAAKTRVVIGRLVARSGATLMQNLRQIEVRTYRGCRLEILDDGGNGWIIAVYVPGEPNPLRMRNRVPHGLGVLMQEAEIMVDLRLAGKVLPDYP